MSNQTEITHQISADTEHSIGATDRELETIINIGRAGHRYDGRICRYQEIPFHGDGSRATFCIGVGDIHTPQEIIPSRFIGIVELTEAQSDDIGESDGLSLRLMEKGSFLRHPEQVYSRGVMLDRKSNCITVFDNISGTFIKISQMNLLRRLLRRKSILHATTMLPEVSAKIAELEARLETGKWGLEDLMQCIGWKAADFQDSLVGD